MSCRSHPPGGMSAAQWAEELATALPRSQAASFRDWMAGCQVAATRPTAGEISDLEDDELWRRMNQPSAGGSAKSSTPKPRRSKGKVARSSTPTLGSHDDAKGKVKGAEGKERQHTKGYGLLATQPFRSARMEGEPHEEVPATPKAQMGQLSQGSLGVGGSAITALSVRRAAKQLQCPDTLVRMSDLLLGAHRTNS